VDLSESGFEAQETLRISAEGEELRSEFPVDCWVLHVMQHVFPASLCCQMLFVF